MASLRSITAPAVALMMVTMALFVAIDPVLAREGPDGTEGEEVPVAVMQEGQNKPIITPYYVKTTSGAAVMAGSLSPAALKVNDTEAVITVPGQMFGRYLGTRVGEFSMMISQAMALEVQGINHASIWAVADEDVQNARFNVYFQKNGQTVRNMQTNTGSLSTMPMEFSVASPPSFVEPVVFQRGDTMSVEFSYFSSPRRLFGPNPGCRVLANSVQHATRIELLCKPLEGNVTSPAFIEDHVHLRGRVLDTSEVDPKTELQVNLEILPSGGGTVKPEHLERMNFVVRETEYIINWSWNYKESGVTDGLFEFKLDVSYGVVGHNYTNSSFYEVKFPKEEGADVVLSTPQLAGIGIVVALVVAIVAFVVLRRRSTAPPHGYGYPGGPPRGAKGPKRPKPTRAQRKAMKRGAPPPGAGPVKGAAPRGDRGEPGPRTPPPGMPPGKPRPPSAGSARPRR